MSRHGFPAASLIFPAAVSRGLSIVTLVLFVIPWAPCCEAGSEIRPVSGMEYTVFATGLAGPRGLLFSPSGDLFAVEQSGGTIVRITPVGGVSRFAKGFSAPHDLAFDTSGYLYVADTGANRVARVSPDGSVTTCISGLNVPVDLAFHPNGELYVCELYAGASVRGTGPSGLLDGRTFFVRAGEKGKSVDHDDYMIFRDGMFVSSGCVEYNFGKSTYTAAAEGNGIRFRAEMASPAFGTMY